MFASTKQLFAEANEPKQLEAPEGVAHGTDMLADQALAQKLYAVLK